MALMTKIRILFPLLPDRFCGRAGQCGSGKLVVCRTSDLVGGRGGRCGDERVVELCDVNAVCLARKMIVLHLPSNMAFASGGVIFSYAAALHLPSVAQQAGGHAPAMRTLCPGRGQ